MFDIFNCFSDEQCTRANISVLANYLASKNIINLEDFYKYYEKNIKIVLEKIVETDRKEFEKAYKEYTKNHNKEEKENNG